MNELGQSVLIWLHLFEPSQLDSKATFLTVSVCIFSKLGGAVQHASACYAMHAWMDLGDAVRAPDVYLAGSAC